MAKYQKTLVVRDFADVPQDTQAGNWIRKVGDKKSARLVSSTNYGVVVVTATGRGKHKACNTQTFRLSRDKGKTVVLGVNR